MEDGHARTTEEVLNHFGTNPDTGLSLDQVKSFQAKYGPNGKSFFTFDFFNLKFKERFVQELKAFNSWKCQKPELLSLQIAFSQCMSFF